MEDKLKMQRDAALPEALAGIRPADNAKEALPEALAGIRPADGAAMARARRRWNSLAKPLGSLGLLEEAVIRLAGIMGTEDVRLSRRELLVLCADNGVVAQGVSQSDASVTAAVAAALGAGTSTVNYMAEGADCGVRAVDVGMLEHEVFPGVEERRVRSGTADMTLGPAMTRGECVAAIETGLSLVREAKARGVSILLAGEMGIGNTTTSCAVLGALLARPPRELAGRGAGLSGGGLERKIRVAETAIAINAPDPKDPIDVLSKIGGLDLAGLCGVCLGGAFYRIPILLDGLIALTAALCAARLCPAARDAYLVSHVSAEPAAPLILRELMMEAPIAAKLRLGEGGGAVAALPLLDMALRVYHSGHTFGRLGIEPYRELSGGPDAWRMDR